MALVFDFLATYYLWIKAAHVISVITWMAGIFYLPRLFVYHVEGYEKKGVEPGSDMDLLFQRQELETLNFSAQAWNELQAEHARLSHAASLLETAQMGVEMLDESDSACLAQLNLLLGRLREGVAFDAALQDTLSMLESAQNELQEAVYALRHYQDRLDADPERLRFQSATGTTEARVLILRSPEEFDRRGRAPGYQDAFGESGGRRAPPGRRGSPRAPPLPRRCSRRRSDACRGLPVSRRPHLERGGGPAPRSPPR